MGRKNNEAFLNFYIELDKTCSEKFGVISDGVGEYINRLNNARFAPNREEVLQRLSAYRNKHRRFQYEPGALRRDKDVTKHDVKWVAKFKRDVQKRRDPISQYLKKAKRYRFKQKLTIVVVTLLVIALIAALIALGFSALG